jgi:hypothetical protein
MFRLEGQGNILDDPFSRVLENGIYWPRPTFSTTDNAFWVAFYVDLAAATPGQLSAALDAVENITREGQQLLADLPKAAKEFLAPPQ